MGAAAFLLLRPDRIALFCSNARTLRIRVCLLPRDVFKALRQKYFGK